MNNTIAILIRNAPDEMRVGRDAIIDGKAVQVSALAFYDIFQSNSDLEEFVSDLAADLIDDPQQAACELMEKLNLS